MQSKNNHYRKCETEVIKIPRSAPWFPPSLLKSPGRINFKYRFTAGERMIFHHWENKYVPTEDYLNLFEIPWCPLFGVLPFKGPFEKDFQYTVPITAQIMIAKLRTYCGIASSLTELCPEAYPDEEVIASLTGYPSRRINAARSMFERIRGEADALITAVDRIINWDAIIKIYSIWSLLKIYFESPSEYRSKFSDIYLLQLSKMQDALDKEAGELAMGEAKALKCYYEFIKRANIQYRTSKSRDKKIENGQKLKNDVLLAFNRLFPKGVSEPATLNYVANTIKKNENKLPSVNTLKKHLKTLASEGKITLPPIRKVNNV